jgi:hypothetical protein
MRGTERVPNAGRDLRNPAGFADSSYGQSCAPLKMREISTACSVT